MANEAIWDGPSAQIPDTKPAKMGGTGVEIHDCLHHLQRDAFVQAQIEEDVRVTRVDC